MAAKRAKALQHVDSEAQSLVDRVDLGLRLRSQGCGVDDETLQ